MGTFELIREFIDICNDIYATIHLFMLFARFFKFKPQ